jgi:hypothetical protein
MAIGMPYGPLTIRPKRRVLPILHVDRTHRSYVRETKPVPEAGATPLVDTYAPLPYAGCNRAWADRGGLLLTPECILSRMRGGGRPSMSVARDAHNRTNPDSNTP